MVTMYTSSSLPANLQNVLLPVFTRIETIGNVKPIMSTYFGKYKPTSELIICEVNERSYAKVLTI